jgi:membrane protein
VWPSLATAAARAANDRVRAAQAAEFVARTQAGNQDDEDWDDDEGDDGDSPYMPSEFPERWSKFLPPEDVKSRLQPSRDKEPDKPNADKRDDESDG